MRKILCMVAVAALLLGSTVLAATGQLVTVEIDSFRAWGVLRWGVWEPIDTRLLSSRITALSSSDAASLTEILARCTVSPPSTASLEGSCGIVRQIRSVREVRYGLQALLGRPYRVRIRNLTPGTLGVVLSIDGLNTYGNLPALGDTSDLKWILRPHQEVTLAGWQLSSAEALQFEFATPSRSHSELDSLRGIIQVAVYPEDPTVGGRGTQAGALIDQPTVVIPFSSATARPVESHLFDYSRDRVVLGVQCEETSGAGIRVTGVVEGTAARVAGLRAGDVITYINAVPINSCAELQSFLATKRPGDRVVLKVHRPDRVFLVTVELEE